MTPRPLHTMNESSSSSIHQIDELVTAKNRFYDNISKGISVLVGKHGYSRERAASLILDQIRLTDEAPIDDEVSVIMMMHYNICIASHLLQPEFEFTRNFCGNLTVDDRRWHFISFASNYFLCNATLYHSIQFNISGVSGYASFGARIRRGATEHCCRKCAEKSAKGTGDPKSKCHRLPIVMSHHYEIAGFCWKER